MKKEEYIENVLKHIQNKAFTNTIRQELESHIEEREQYYIDIGYDEQTSQQKAIERMGSADELGFKMDMLHDYKKHKIICIAGLIIFILNFVSLRLITTIFYSDIIEQFSVIIALFCAYIVYHFAFAARCKVVLFIQGIASLWGVIRYTTGIDQMWMFGSISFKNVTGEEMALAVITLITGLLFLINTVICLTCSGEISALIKGRPNTKMLNRYKSYEYILLIGAVIITIASIAYLINTDSFALIYSIGQG